MAFNLLPFVSTDATSDNRPFGRLRPNGSVAGIAPVA